jgi:hypothetical protein
MFPFPARSHMIIQRGLMLELASRGHDVTEVTPFPEGKLVPNYTSIEVKADLLKVAGGSSKRKQHSNLKSFTAFTFIF